MNKDDIMFPIMLVSSFIPIIVFAIFPQQMLNFFGVVCK